MLQRLVLLFVILALNVYASRIDQKIQTSKAKLTTTKNAYAYMDKKLAKIAKEIESNQNELKKLDNVIRRLEKEITLNAVVLTDSNKRLVQIQNELKKLGVARQKQQEKLIDLLANRYIAEEIMKEKGFGTPRDVLEAEALKAIVELDNSELKSLEKSFMATLRQNEALKNEALRIKRMISRLEKRKERAAREKKRRKELMAKLQKEKIDYQKRLQKLQNEEKSLRETLSRLNILRRKTIEEKRARERATKATGGKLHVRNIGSSYQRHSIGRYRGSKTFSPVGRAKIVKKFGLYVDPVYKIKIFNESVTLKPTRSNAKVKNVLNGRIVFIKDTPMLGKVVIVEHAHNLHTIYAKLDKIAPTIKEGKKVKKGYVIGRVKDELMFEVTQKNRHINPLELIRLN
ncbi:murein hydrolase activator EnvC family protein [Hydrogenimonas sp.]